jgi:hypothetical protein
LPPLKGLVPATLLPEEAPESCAKAQQSKTWRNPISQQQRADVLERDAPAPLWLEGACDCATTK